MYCLKLLVNLRNAVATFGEGTPPVEGIRTTIEDHIQAMKAKGVTTNLPGARRRPDADLQIIDSVLASQPTTTGAMSFGSLAFRPK